MAEARRCREDSGESAVSPPAVSWMPETACNRARHFNEPVSRLAKTSVKRRAPCRRSAQSKDIRTSGASRGPRTRSPIRAGAATPTVPSESGAPAMPDESGGQTLPALGFRAMATPASSAPASHDARASLLLHCAFPVASRGPAVRFRAETATRAAVAGPPSAEAFTPPSSCRPKCAPCRKSDGKIPTGAPSASDSDVLPPTAPSSPPVARRVALNDAEAFTSARSFSRKGANSASSFSSRASPAAPAPKSRFPSAGRSVTETADVAPAFPPESVISAFRKAGAARLSPPAVFSEKTSKTSGGTEASVMLSLSRRNSGSQADRLPSIRATSPN